MMRAGVGGSGGVSRRDVHRGEPDEDGTSAREEERGGAEDRVSNDLREMISSHPLYDKLVGIHLDCLKAGGVGNLDASLEITTQLQQHDSREPDRNLPQHISDLDQFMESYCFVLSKLREAMEEPQAEATSFVDEMHSRLDEIVKSLAGERPPRSSPSHFSGNASS
ncbi:hypothetical protein MLD38_012460 [Melastoma candidum]|uniref:Uncharacterized protein n=1 Tax=Melastoma candidum TaxID=119954 RepID=A0ACB9R6F3_9MYRT|nr:hypothetical protein MLD38_012460 [Melastoma candidum]